jgi:hypothetical protein
LTMAALRGLSVRVLTAAAVAAVAAVLGLVALWAGVLASFENGSVDIRVALRPAVRQMTWLWSVSTTRRSIT